MIMAWPPGVGGPRARRRRVPAIRARAGSRSGVGPGGATRARRPGTAPGRLRVDGGRGGAGRTGASTVRAGSDRAASRRFQDWNEEQETPSRAQKAEIDRPLVECRWRRCRQARSRLGSLGRAMAGSWVGERGPTRQDSRRGKTGFTVRLQDSYDILPALTGRSPNAPIRPATVLHGGNGIFAIRSGPWKLVKSDGSEKKGAAKSAPRRRTLTWPQIRPKREILPTDNANG